MGIILFPFPITLKLLGKFNNKILVPLLFLAQLQLSASQNYLESKPCAVLHSKENFEGHQFTLKDGEQTNHLSGDSLGWNATGSVSVESGCMLEVCNKAYFDCAWKTLVHGSYATTESMNLSDISSASCTCHKECKCSDIFMKKTSCARAYLEGGCQTCHALYTDMQGSQSQFPEEFIGNVEAFRLRKGCSVTLYSKENFEGEADIFYEETVEDYSGEFRSYECDCDDSLFVPRVKPPRPESYPPLINIPETLEDAIRSMNDKRYTSHPGIKASHMSMQNRRSSKNAYILLLGSTGSGRSTAINLLFDNPNITGVGGDTTTTTDINEFRIPVPIDELGIGNSELRVIDTPGLGHTDGLQQDAKFLASLDSYLSNHEELKERIPNVVLIFHKFSDNRYNGEGSAFVKMLRGLDSLRERITDENYSNVIFVLSHFCSETKANQKRPAVRLARFKSVIEEYSLFPKPIIITVAENKAQEQNLPMVNGYFKLPNNEYYPKNLFDKMELVTEMGEDMIGLGVFRSAFRDSDDFNVTRLTYKLLDESPKSDHYFYVISKAYFSIEKTEVTELLQIAWENDLNTSLKQQYPSSLPYLQKVLSIKHINTRDDLPKTTPEILALFTAIKHNDAMYELLKIALNLEAPPFPTNTIAGFSYNIFKDTQLPNSPFSLGDVMGSDIGFLIPKTLTCKVEPSSKQNFYIFDTQQQYVMHRIQSLGIEGTIGNESFEGVVKPGHNIKAISLKDDSCSLSATREFRLFDFTLNDKVDLTDEFQKVVKNLTEFDQSDNQTVEQWKDFFTEYGTHVVKSVYGGGAIEIQLDSDKPYDSNMAQVLLDLIQFIDELPYEAIGPMDEDEEGELSPENGKNSTEVKPFLPEGFSHSLKFVGGDPMYHKNDFTNMPAEEASNLLRNWKHSLKFYPTMLTTEMRLIPISQVVRKLGQSISSKIEKATSLLFNSELKYSPAKKESSSPGNSRDDTSKINGFLGLGPQTHFDLENMQRAMEELKNAEREHEWRHKMKLQWLEWERNGIPEQLTLNKSSHDAWTQWLARREKEGTHITPVSVIKIRGMAKLSNRTRPGGNCLKQGTKILMADMSEKDVENLKVGDLIMDKDFKPSRVLGVSFELLMEQKFYGFKKDAYFFTNGHIFVGPSKELYAQSLEEVFRTNPLMEYMQMKEFGGANVETQLYYLQKPQDDNDQAYLGVRSVIVQEDPTSYPLHTPVYFLIVDSPTGSYFANGYVCRHDIPPMEIWPHTMGLLFRLTETPTFQRFAEIPYNLSTVSFVEGVTDQVVEKMKNYIEGHVFQFLYADETDKQNNFPVMALLEGNFEELVSKAFDNPTASLLSIGLYSRVGKVISPYLDSASYGTPNNFENKMGWVQHEMFNVIHDELKKHVKL